MTELNSIFPIHFNDDVPFRLRVQRSLTEALEQISEANLFQSDLSPFMESGSERKRVFRGRQLFGDDDPLPMVSILEEPIAPENDLAPISGKTGVGSYDLIVQGYVPDEIENPTDSAHVLMADVKKRLIQLRSDENRDDRVFRFGAKANTVVGISFGARRRSSFR